MKKLLSYYFYFIYFSCQPIEKVDKIVFDNNQFSKFEILSKKY